jgi:hypothetical protein
MFQLSDSKYFNPMDCLMANIVVALNGSATRLEGEEEDEGMEVYYRNAHGYVALRLMISN